MGSLLLGLAAALVVLLLPTQPAKGQPARAAVPVAVLTEIRPGTGDVRVRAAGAGDWVAPKALQGLRPGDQVRVTGDARVTVVFTGGRAQAVTAATSPLTVEAPATPGTADRVRGVVGSVSQFLLGQQKAATYQSLSVRSGGALPVRILVPRDTRVLADAVTFDWSGPARPEYRLRVSGPSGETVWEQSGLPRRPLLYPAAAPALTPGTRYVWTVELPGQPPQRAEFEVMPAPDAARVRSALADLTTGSEGSTGALLRAGLLLQEGLVADARRELTGAIAADPDEPTLRLLLGYVYDRLGLKELAAREFDEAEYLATRRP
jgi:hypothetical protein